MSDLLIVMDEDEHAFSVMGVVSALDGVVHDHGATGVIDCSIPSEHVSAVKATPGVMYVRHVQSYLSHADDPASEW